MKWRNREGTYRDRECHRATLVDIPRKKFAWWPITTVNQDVLWLEYYHARWQNEKLDGSFILIERYYPIY